jgi:hypothetical protein
VVTAQQAKAKWDVRKDVNKVLVKQEPIFIAPGFVAILEKVLADFNGNWISSK